MSGQPPLEIDGKRLDPYSQFWLFRSDVPVDLEHVSPEDVRRIVALQRSAPVPPEALQGLEVTNETIKTNAHAVPVRIYRPHDMTPDAVAMVFFHGGGGVVGDIDACEPFCALLARRAGRPVISVEYRLAPEARWPAAIDDAVCAFEWALAKAETLGAREGRASVGGEGLGASLATIVCQEMKAQGAPLPESQLLIHPIIDQLSDTPSMQTYADIRPYTRQLADYYRKHFVPEGADLEDPRLSPGLCTDLHDLPSALIVLAGFDMLKDQGRQYHNRLSDAGVDSELIVFETLANGFVSLAHVSPNALEACQRIIDKVGHS